jgi:anti-sigma factor RsiW
MSVLSRDLVCRQAVQLMSDYLDGALSRRDRRRLERHLASCDACQAYLDQLRTTVAVTGAPDDTPVAPEVLDALVQVFEQFHRDEPTA